MAVDAPSSAPPEPASAAPAGAQQTLHPFPAPAAGAKAPPGGGRLVVTYVRAPLPPAALGSGRMSFGPAPPPAAAQEQQGAMEISDADMAEHQASMAQQAGQPPFRHKKQKQQQQPQARPAASQASAVGRKGGLADLANSSPPAGKQHKPDKGGAQQQQQPQAKQQQQQQQRQPQGGAANGGGGKATGKHPASTNPYATLREAKRSKPTAG